MEKPKIFKHEERFLEFITEEHKELFSITELVDGHGLNPNLLIEKNKFIEYLMEGTQYSNGISYSDSIFLYDENIYLYLSKSEPMISSFFCKIYYPIRRKKDVEFFILNLKKLKKDGN